MRSAKNTMLLLVPGAVPFASAGLGAVGGLNLSQFQRVLRTGLDGELAKITDGSPSIAQTNSIHSPNRRAIDTERKSNMRRRAPSDEVYERQDSFAAPQTSSPSFTEDEIWADLLLHAWNTAQTIRRDEHKGLSVTSNPLEAHPCPFLICAHGRKQPNSDDVTGIEDIVTIFHKKYEESLLVSSSHNETCVILTTSALQTHQIMESPEGRQNLVALPLVDVSKIHAGTVDEVSSQGWSVPFRDEKSSDMNETEAINEWERIIAVDFVPGLGGMKEEAELLKVVNDMMGDIQDMGEVGWLRSMEKEEAEEYFIDESLIDVPALSDMFSLTSSLRTIKEMDVDDNARISFWNDSLRHGIQSEHGCSEMFSTLFVKPRAGYYGYDLVLNPSDGPPPQEYESSASNPACVTSLVAALSTHPYVLSVKANFPIYHGWHVAQKLDSF